MRAALIVVLLSVVLVAAVVASLTWWSATQGWSCTEPMVTPWYGCPGDAR